MDDKYIATIMKKHSLQNGETIYSIADVKIGTLNKENGTFVDEDGVVYRHICDKTEIGRKAASKEYYNLMSIKEIQDQYPDYSIEDIIETMIEGKKSILYYYCTMDSSQPLVITIDTNSIKQSVIDSRNGSKQYEPNEEEEVAELIARISTGCFTEDELQKLKDDTGLRMAYLTSIMESIDNHLEEVSEEKEEKIEEIDIINIYDELRKVVIDQDEAARRLLIEIERSLNEHDGTGILVTGNSGSGKTLLMSEISKHIKRPFLIIDSLQLTTPGHTGRSIEQYLWDLYETCDYDQDAAEHAIVYFDEIDKKGSPQKSDIAGQGVLNQLLKFLDGTTYIACKNPQVITDTTSIPLSTKNMTVIAGGAFSEIYEALEKNSIGFNTEQSTAKKTKEPEIKDFIDKAMMPKEFMGRLPVIVHLNTLTSDSLKKILTDSAKSPLKTQEKQFSSKGVKIKVTEAYLEAVSDKAIKRKIGARGLHKIIKDTTSEPYFMVRTAPGEYEELILDAPVVEDNKNYQLIKRRTTI